MKSQHRRVLAVRPSPTIENRRMAGRRAPHPSQPTHTHPRAAAHLQTHPACTRRLTSTRSAPVRFGHSRVPVAARHTNTLGARCARVRRQAVARPRAPTAILGTQNGSDGRTVSFPQSNWIACVAHNSRRTENYSISCRCKSRDSYQYDSPKIDTVGCRIDVHVRSIWTRLRAYPNKLIHRAKYYEILCKYYVGVVL